MPQETPSQVEQGTPVESEADLQNRLEGEVGGAIGADPLVFEDEQKAELDRIRGVAQEQESGELPTLGEETKEQMDTQLAAQEGALEMQRQQGKDDLLLRMFGKGGQQSTVAGEAAGRMLYGQEQTRRQLLADDASRRLGARADMADRIMNSLAFQAQVAQGQQQTALQAFGLEVSQIESGKDRATSMLDSLYGRRSAEKQTKMQTRAQITSANISASAQRYSADASARAQLGSARISAQSQKFAVKKQFKLGKMEMRSGNRQFQQDLGFRQSNLAHQDKWQNQDFSLREKELQYQDKWNKAEQKTAKRGQMMAFAGGLLSDINLKQNVQVIDNPIDKVKGLKGVTWDWLGSDAASDAGVIAQDVEKVMPSAIDETPEGFKTVNYAAVVGLLVAAVNELIERQD